MIFSKHGNEYGSIFFRNLLPKGDELEYYIERYQELLKNAKNTVLINLMTSEVE